MAVSEFILDNPEGHTSVLLIEDSDAHNKLLMTYFAQNGFNCDSVRTLALGRRRIEKNSYDIILLDHHLPDGLGLDFMDMLSERGIDVPVMMISSNDDYQLIQECYEQGVSDFMPKPLHLPLLVFKIQRLIFNYWLRQNVQTQNARLEDLLTQKQGEEILAKHVFEHLSSKEHLCHEHVQSLMRPSSAFNGDLLLSRCSPGGNLFVLLLDATGHGLAAAISVLPVVSIFRAMVSKGCPMAMLAYELNQRLIREIPGDRFVAGVLVEVDPHRREVSVWNGGMPDALLCDDSGHVMHRLISRHMPFGVLDSEVFDSSIETLPLGELESQLFMISDGVIDQTSQSGEAFGMQRVERLIELGHGQDTVERISKALQFHCGDEEFSDDVSICRVDCKAYLNTHSSAQIPAYSHPGNLHFETRLSGYQLGEMDLLSWVNALLQVCPLAPELRQKVFTVCAELVSNAIDHGVLRLDSTLKNDIDGFVNYLEQREKRVATLQESDWVEVAMDWNTPANEVAVMVKDSGLGYQAMENVTADDHGLSGRGLALVRNLVSVFRCDPPGNQTYVLIR
ncbi:SpoIIE family protein phosphatase [Bowmanella sp. Y26]|uniref:SpoIIE family protein phosphatase n=1 Tax=Bowmanella yangjiangensis TaxID=2811230 RepID=UPI001BDCE5D8|nr:SpoIIE family protein phosphatase [Bowmanella yangjiangensis]MBT1065306.1 SpoIIE family protein phosphatase [Bowmanella yangjiangensis]